MALIAAEDQQREAWMKSFGWREGNDYWRTKAYGKREKRKDDVQAEWEIAARDINSCQA